jgi:hypothetical protein
MLVMGYLVASTFFFTYWRSTRDRLFAFFAGSFFLMSAERFGEIVANPNSQTGFEERHPGFYIIRLIAFVLILIAILDKNRSHQVPDKE